MEKNAQLFPGLGVYWDIEASVLKSMDVIHLPFCKEVLMLSGVSISNVSDFRYLFNELGSRIVLHLLLGFGTKKNLLKKPRYVCDLFHCVLLNQCM